MQDSAALPSNPSASDLISRGVAISIPAEQPLRHLGAARSGEYSLKAESHQIDQEEAKLLEWCKATNRFLSREEVALFEQQAGIQGGGSEHDGWVVECSGRRIFIRRTIKDSYGFAHSSPFQYLQRIADVSAIVPNAPIQFLCMSQNSRGNGVIWTVQPYIEGTHPNLPELVRFLEAHGWIEIKSKPEHLIFQHKATGITMHDAHPGNFIKTTKGEFIPIDVFFEGMV